MSAVGPADLDGAVRELYGAEPSAFVSMRTALVKELRASGHRDVAAAVGRLRKPTVVEAAFNRVAREQPAIMERWASARAAASTAQSAAIGGAGADQLRAATNELRTATSDAVRIVGQVAGAAKTGEITSMLRAVGTDEEAALFVQGILGSTESDGDQEEVDPFAGAPDPPPQAARPAQDRATRAPARRPPPAIPPPARNPRDERLRRQARHRAERDVAAAEREVARLEEQLAAARKRLDTARRAVPD